MGHVTYACFVRFGVHGFRFFAAIRVEGLFILWGHREQDAPDNKNKSKKQGTRM